MTERGENVVPPEGLLFSKEHEWVKLDGESATIGITDYAQSALGDIVYVELPKVGAAIKQFSNIGVIESVKAVSDLFTPMSGEIVEVNEALQDDPAAVNREPYGAGWLLKLRALDPNETKTLLSAADYQKIAVE
jgi:glycine cleavage system H protein